MCKHYLNNSTQKFLILIFLQVSLFANYAQGQYYSTRKVDNSIANLPGALRVLGYLESLPPNYNADPQKKFPLLVYLHRTEEAGTGTPTSLDLVSDVGVPKLIKDGVFPTSFKVGGEDFSFIVISPQYVSNIEALVYEINKFIDTCANRYKVDTSRIYLTGVTRGGGVAWLYNVAAAHTQRLAAMLPINGNKSYSEVTNGVSNIVNSNLPVWTTTSDESATYHLTNNWITQLNLQTPTLEPLAKKTVMDLTTSDAWTPTYDPTFKENGLNVYEWMLQYTNKKLVANAGPTQGFTKIGSSTTTVTLDGSKSHARGGRITSYAWTKIAGKSGTTITSPSNKITTVTGLTDSTYLFRLTVMHTDGSTASDTVKISTQTSRKIDSLSANLPAMSFGGMIESLPVDYDEDKTKRYPLIIHHHGRGEIKVYSDSNLQRLYNNEIPRMLKEGTFPASIEFENKKYSFIVIAPQKFHNGRSLADIKKFIDTLNRRYRIDTTRIYMTGLSHGGGVTLSTMRDTSYANRFAAILPVCGDNPMSDTTRVIPAIGGSNLPVLATHNNADPQVLPSLTTAWINRLISYSPALNPQPIKTFFTASSHNAWTKTYDPNSVVDVANNYNAYQWMLQYTNEKLVAKAGPDKSLILPASSVTVDGGKSMARGGRCSTYVWTQISGPNSATIPVGSSASKTITGLIAGTYEFELTVTHTDGVTISKDRVLVTVSAASPRQAGPEEKLPPVDASKEFLDVTLNPNPVRSNLTVFVSGKATGTASLALYNLQGQKLIQQQFNKPSAQTIARNVQVSNLPGGAYAIQVVLAGKTKVIQFIKE